MVFQKKPDFESFSRQVTAMPHVPRSARGKRSSRKKDSPMCAFDLLATVAGKLLVEGEDSPFLASVNYAASSSSPVKSSSIKHEHFDEARMFNKEVQDQDSCNESPRNGSCGLGKEESGSPSRAVPPIDPATAKADALDKESMVSCGKRGFCLAFGKTLDWGSPDPVESADWHVDAMKAVYGDKYESVNADKEMDLTYMDVKLPPPLVSSDSSGEMPECGGPIRKSSSFPRGQKGGTFVQKDDDDNSSACTQPSTITTKAYKLHCIDDRRRVRKMASKFRRGAPPRFYKGELSNSDVETKPSFRNSKMGYTRQRTQKSMFKRRRLLDHCSVITAAEDLASCRDTINMNASKHHGITSGANGPSTSVACQKPTFESKDCHVKMSIKSFRVPELVIEIPENATVGSLKRAVMETLSSLLENGLRVGVLLNGKKVRDDSRSLFEAGLSHDDNLDDLCFSLEPNSPQQAPPSTPDPHSGRVLEHSDIVKPIARILPADLRMKPEQIDASPPPRRALIPVVGHTESDRDSVQSPNIPLPDSDKSKAIVLVSSVKSEALAVAPLRKVKRSEQGQRRIRRPFSVSEVEALVQAVEKLGTGRWRDVKLQAFDNAKHRTYVDLKDKWKTLVHTASISPQQRRGEPVPQELLDRVLLAQAYWSQQQAKLQPRSAAAAEALLLTI